MNVTCSYKHLHEQASQKKAKRDLVKYTMFLQRSIEFLFFFFSVQGKLKQFVLDLHSGKLHREFHHGPDPTDTTPGQVSQHHQQELFSYCLAAFA